MTSIDRRAMIAASGAALLLPSVLHAQSRAQRRATPFSWDMLLSTAQRLSRARFVETPAHPGAARVDYLALHQARFRDERTIWNDRPGDVAIRLFPLSATAPQPVAIHIVDAGRATPLRYDPTMFDAPAGNAVADLGPDAGYSGFRVMNGARDADWLSFIGASYFRAAGAQKQYGLSARAVAINTSAGGEEFPRFTTFWLEHGGPDRLTVYALLDGASITGAFRFINRLSGGGVRQEVTATLFPRRAIKELGLMPMTSMFWYDQANRPTANTDWRPEIHDSDMLAIRSADGSAHARPLVNPRLPHLSVFEEKEPAGFGLIQRDRDFDHYQDDGVFYDRRPSLWATPQAVGEGAIRLYAFPTDSEYTDNVAAYWTPAAPAQPGGRIDAAYMLDWLSSETPLAVARLADVWRGAGDAPGVLRLVLDFAGVEGKPELWVDLTDGALIKQAAYPVLTRPGIMRAVLDVRPNGTNPVDIRAQLRSGDRPVSEMVHYPLGA